jgi:uncharacterized protein YmfQ (DUF2313 family)
MPAPTFTGEDFLAGFQALLPTGPVWPREPDATLTQTLLALSTPYTGNAASAGNLLNDAFPATTESLIPEWEESLGLPDPCTPDNPSTAQRRAAILAKFIGSGGQSAQYFINVAKALGFTITITEFSPFRLGYSTLGSPLMGPGWEDVWRINAPDITVSYFRLGISKLGDPFWTIGNTELECRLRSIAPAHTILQFVYGGAVGGTFYNNGGVLALSGSPDYPISTAGLAAGDLWSNGGVVSVMPGATPDPTAPPVFFSSLTPLELLALGGGNLPTTAPAPGSTQLWNSSGDEVWIA